LADEDVAPVERGARDLHEGLPGAGRRIVDLLDAEVLRTALAVDLVKSDGLHSGRVRGAHRERLPRTVNEPR
jgi:hypothetical protein